MVVSSIAHKFGASRGERIANPSGIVGESGSVGSGIGFDPADPVGLRAGQTCWAGARKAQANSKIWFFYELDTKRCGSVLAP